MNWKTTVSKLNTKHYRFPSGWDTRETIAEQLECSVDRVDILLAPGLKSGEIEKQQFPVWDPRLNRKTLVWGYRSIEKTSTTKDSNTEISDDVVQIVKSAASRHPGKTISEIRNRLPKSVRSNITTEMIRTILK